MKRLEKRNKLQELKTYVILTQVSIINLEEFATYLSYARNLKFEEQPDYDYLKSLMNKGIGAS